MITEKIAKCPWVDGLMDGHNVVHRTTGYYSALKRKEVLTLAKHGWTLSHSVSTVAQSCPAVCDPMDCSTPGLPVHHQLLELAQTHVHQVWWWHRTISSFVTPFSRLQSFPASRSFLMSQFLASTGQSIGRFCFSISPSNEYSGLISFRMDWLDLLEIQGTLKSSPTPQFKSINSKKKKKASILRHSAFFTVQLSHPYMTTGKTIALTRQTFVGKVMSLLYDVLSRLVMNWEESSS